MSLILWILLAFLTSLVLTPVCKRLALQFDLVTAPHAGRWRVEPVPLLGGVAIFVSVMLLAVLQPAPDRTVWSLLVGSGAIFALGLVDDVRSLKPQTKFVGQVLVASVLVALGLRINATFYPFLNILITIVWIVGITNAFNLLDNMDGLASGIAVITVGFRMVLLVLDGNLQTAILAAIFIGAVLGFLVYNRHPASIFLGDAGSLFIGCFVAGLSLVGGWPYSRGIASVLLFPVLILLVPIFDTTFVALTRRLANRPVSRGGVDHTSHRLVALGLSEPQAVIVLYGVALLSGGVAFLGYTRGLSYTVVLIAFLVIGLMLLGIYLARIRVYPEEAVEVEQTSMTGVVQLVKDFTYKRQIGAVLLDSILIILAYYSACLLRFEDEFPLYEAFFLASLPIVLCCQLFSLAVFRVYQGVWRYTSLSDMIRLVKAISMGTLMTVLVVVFAYRFEGYSRSVFVLDWVLLLLFVAGSRASFRVIGELLPVQGAPDASRVVIYGAGDGGVLTLREILNNPALKRTPVGFIDDDRSKLRTHIQGYEVLGDVDRLEDVIRTHGVSEVVVTSSKILEERFRQLTRICEGLGVSVVRASMRLE